MITYQQARDIAESLNTSAFEADRLAKELPTNLQQARAAKNITLMARHALQLALAVKKYENERNR